MLVISVMKSNPGCRCAERDRMLLALRHRVHVDADVGETRLDECDELRAAFLRREIGPVLNRPGLGEGIAVLDQCVHDALVLRSLDIQLAAQPVCFPIRPCPCRQ